MLTRVAAAAVDTGPVIEVAELPPANLWKPVESGPAIELGEAPLGRETLAIIEADARRGAQRPDPGASSPAVAGRAELARDIEPAAAVCEALELKSFIVPASALSPKASDDVRRTFVRERLAQHLPCAIERVKRIDARLFEPGAVLVRVFCPVD